MKHPKKICAYTPSNSIFRFFLICLLLPTAIIISSCHKNSEQKNSYKVLSLRSLKDINSKQDQQIKDQNDEIIKLKLKIQDLFEERKNKAQVKRSSKLNLKRKQNKVISKDYNLQDRENYLKAFQRKIKNDEKSIELERKRIKKAFDKIKLEIYNIDLEIKIYEGNKLKNQLLKNQKLLLKKDGENLKNNLDYEVYKKETVEAYGEEKFVYKKEIEKEVTTRSFEFLVQERKKVLLRRKIIESEKKVLFERKDKLELAKQKYILEYQIFQNVLQEKKIKNNKFKLDQRKESLIKKIKELDKDIAQENKRKKNLNEIIKIKKSFSESLDKRYEDN